MPVQEKSPKQQNSYDCGLYVVLNAERMCTWLATVIASVATDAASTPRPQATRQPPGLASPSRLQFKSAAFTPADVSAYRALALASLTRIWLDGMDIPISDERWEVHNVALANLPECLRGANLR